MSKAYDSVHILLLAKVLTRLKIPTTITKLITNIFTRRTNSVITNLGTIQLYSVQDDID